MPHRIIAELFLVTTLLTFSFSVRAASSGTGFFISSDGLVATNYHVIENAEVIRVVLRDGRVREASAVVIDRANDLAVLQVSNVTDQAFLKLRSSTSVGRGSSVFTIGFPLIAIQGTEPKVASGIISSLTGLADDPTKFQVSVPVQLGNSGGPLVSMDGAVIGVVSSKLNSSVVQRLTGDVPQNVSYAVKSNYLMEMFSLRVIRYRRSHAYSIGTGGAYGAGGRRSRS